MGIFGSILQRFGLGRVSTTPAVVISSAGLPAAADSDAAPAVPVAPAEVSVDMDDNHTPLSRHSHVKPLARRLSNILDGFPITNDHRERILGRIISGVMSDLYDFDDAPSSFVFAGPNHQLKRNLAEALASALGLSFVYVNCKDYPPDDPNDTSRKTPYAVKETSMDSKGQRYLQAALAYPKRYDMIDWMMGPTPGFVEYGENLAERLRRDPKLFVFIDRPEETDFNFLRLLRNVIEEGKLKGTTLHGSIFALATEAFEEELARNIHQRTNSTDDEEHVFRKLWMDRMRGQSTVVNISTVVLFRVDSGVSPVDDKG